MSVGFLPKRSILVAHRGMLGLRAWADGLVVVLFEFLDDDTKLVTRAHCPVCGVSLLFHASVVFVLCVLPRIPRFFF